MDISRDETTLERRNTLLDVVVEAGHLYVGYVI